MSRADHSARMYRFSATNVCGRVAFTQTGNSQTLRAQLCSESPAMRSVTQHLAAKPIRFRRNPLPLNAVTGGVHRNSKHDPASYRRCTSGRSGREAPCLRLNMKMHANAGFEKRLSRSVRETTWQRVRCEDEAAAGCTKTTARSCSCLGQVDL